MSKLQNFLKGLIKENPTLVLVLGTCPTPGHLHLRGGGRRHGPRRNGRCCLFQYGDFRPAKGHPRPGENPCYIVLIAGFVSVVEMVLEAYAFSLYESLGVYLSLIVVNCIILGRAEMYANKNKVIDSAHRRPGHGPRLHPGHLRNGHHP